MAKQNNEDIYEIIRRQQEMNRAAIEEGQKLKQSLAAEEATKHSELIMRPIQYEQPRRKKNSFQTANFLWYAAGLVTFPILFGIINTMAPARNSRGYSPLPVQTAPPIVATAPPVQPPISAEVYVAAPNVPTQSSADSILNDNTIDVDISDCHVKYLRHEVVENLAGTKCVAVYFQFTNNSKKDKSFNLTVTDKAFQDGIELESSWFHVSDESHDSGAAIKPGVSVTVCSAFALRNEVSSVELEVREWITLKNNPADKMVLSIR